MTGAEIEATFGNSEVRLLEDKQREIEIALEVAQSQLETSEDVEEQESLRDRLAELRDQSRDNLTNLRAAAKKFSSSTGFKKAS